MGAEQHMWDERAHLPLYKFRELVRALVAEMVEVVLT